MGKFSQKVFRFVIDESSLIDNGLSMDDISIDLVNKASLIGFDYTKSNDGIMSYIEIDENISEFYIRDDGDSVESMFSILSEKFSDVTVEECTNDILFNNELIYGIKDSEELYDKRKILFEKFRKELTSTDDVLDKIIDKGMDYLDEIDKEILESKKPS